MSLLGKKCLRHRFMQENLIKVAKFHGYSINRFFLRASQLQGGGSYRPFPPSNRVNHIKSGQFSYHSSTHYFMAQQELIGTEGDKSQTLHSADRLPFGTDRPYMLTTPTCP